MKKIFSVVLLSLGALVVVAPSQADPAQQTPITEKSYSDFQTACYDACFDGANTKVAVDKAAVYCMCACGQATMNCREVVQRFHLKYEKEFYPHQADMSLNLTQLNTCKSKAG